jgi:hypothetical protein
MRSIIILFRHPLRSVLSIIFLGILSIACGQLLFF